MACHISAEYLNLTAKNISRAVISIGIPTSNDKIAFNQNKQKAGECQSNKKVVLQNVLHLTGPTTKLLMS